MIYSYSISLRLKLFLSGEYDYFYRDFMEKKTVIKYNPFIDKTNLDLMNKHNIITTNNRLINYYIGFNYSL